MRAAAGCRVPQGGESCVCDCVCSVCRAATLSPECRATTLTPAACYVCGVQCRIEVPRITELLIELPAEIDVEGLLARAIALPPNNKVAPDS